MEFRSSWRYVATVSVLNCSMSYVIMCYKGRHFKKYNGRLRGVDIHDFRNNFGQRVQKTEDRRNQLDFSTKN